MNFFFKNLYLILFHLFIFNANAKQIHPNEHTELTFLEKVQEAKNILRQYPTGRIILKELEMIYSEGVEIRPATGSEYPTQFNSEAAVKVSEQNTEIGLDPHTGHYYLRIKPSSSIAQMAHAIAHGSIHIKHHKQLDYFSAINPAKIGIVIAKTQSILDCLSKNGFQICEMGYGRTSILRTVAYSLLDEYRAFLVNESLTREGMPKQELLEKGTLAELLANVYWPMITGFRVSVETSQKVIRIMDPFPTPMDLVIKHHPELKLERYNN